MDFSEVELDDRHAEFAREIADFFAAWAGPEALAHEQRTGDGFNEPLHLAMGARGWLFDTWPRAEGGAELDRIEHRILTLGRERTGLPFITLDTTRVVAEAIRRHGQEAVRARLVLEAARGETRFCLGYTEPEGGSDVAAVRTRAERQGSDWLVHGSKMFTTGAHNCQYAFTIVRTNTQAPKHAGLTMLLVPLDAAGVEISPIRTFGGERTNIVYFDGVRVPDVLRIGPVDGGWSILHERLDVEHGIGSGEASDGLEPPSVRTTYAIMLARCVDAVHEWAHSVAEGATIDRGDVRYRLGLVAVEAEAALSAPGHHGRVKASAALIDGSARLYELLGARAFADGSTAGSTAVSLVEFAHRYAQGTAIYGGTLEVFRNMIAHQDLGLPRPTYSDQVRAQPLGDRG